ncbi:hypothetical protein HanRHA438_Chr05g0226971 [Helianthus annuus]|nr:hypothetical protein HanRHA438_Chr05g0226971 [Helianthus annuus]
MKSSEGLDCISLTSCRILLTDGFFMLYLSPIFEIEDRTDLEVFEEGSCGKGVISKGEKYLLDVFFIRGGFLVEDMVKKAFFFL